MRTVFVERKQKRWVVDFWSGLSESNRHLNLGKVPYYHYTKAAHQPIFLYHAVPSNDKSCRVKCVRKLNSKQQRRSRDLADAR
jgi:hypothetical protein